MLFRSAGNNQIFRFGYTKTPTTIVVDPNDWVTNKTGTITNATVVPVKFTSLTGVAKTDCSYSINWTTQAEINVQSYGIEVSFNGLDYQEIGTAIPQRNTNNTYSFSYTNEINPSCTFRISIKKPDGTKTYSTAIILNSICEKPFVVSLNSKIGRAHV